MKKIICLILLTSRFTLLAQSNETLQIIDLSQIQIRLLNANKSVDSATKSKIYLDSIYTPHQSFWRGYAGEPSDFISWMTKEGVVFLDYLNKRNAAINGEKLLKQFQEVKDSMVKLTGYAPVGKWYIVYFHGATDLGGLGSGEMLIDLSHESNSTNDKIMKMFPHEITHQIMNNTNKNHDSTAMNTIIGEGFAVFMNEVYWGNKYSLAENLGYTEDELKQCRMHKDIIRRFFEENKYAKDSETIDKFRNRNHKIHPKLPGAIGYYIGYEIIREYAKKSSWKDVFSKSPKVIYQLSGY